MQWADLIHRCLRIDKRMPPLQPQRGGLRPYLLGIPHTNPTATVIQIIQTRNSGAGRFNRPDHPIELIHDGHHRTVNQVAQRMSMEPTRMA